MEIADLVTDAQLANGSVSLTHARRIRLFGFASSPTKATRCALPASLLLLLANPFVCGDPVTLG
jgi:hypothetical protein